MNPQKRIYISLSFAESNGKTAKPDTTEPKGAEGDDKSDVGLDEPQVQDKSPVTASDIALEALVQCEANGITIQDFMLALKEQLILVDEKVAA